MYQLNNLSMGLDCVLIDIGELCLHQDLTMKIERSLMWFLVLSVCGRSSTSMLNCIPIRLHTDRYQCLARADM